jgi:hypothetical protein
MAVYCSHCGSDKHPVGACPFINDKSIRRLEREALHSLDDLRKSWDAYDKDWAPGGRHKAEKPKGKRPKKKGCLSVLVAYVGLLALLVIGLLLWLV